MLLKWSLICVEYASTGIRDIHVAVKFSTVVYKELVKVHGKLELTKLHSTFFAVHVIDGFLYSNILLTFSVA